MKGQKALSEVDVAYEILKKEKEPIYFRELLKQVLKKQKRAVQCLPKDLAEIHTQINLDSRFSFLGKGMWGLSEWAPRKNVSEQKEAKPVSAAQLRRMKLLAEIQQQEADAQSNQEE